MSEAKTEIMRSRTRRMPESTATFIVEAAGQVYIQTNEFIYLGGTSTTMPTYPLRSTGAHATDGAASENTLDLYDRPSATLELKSGC